MLQQTTTTAVIPFFERFVERFPTLESLARAESGAVMEAWAGLGYYSRARNLHRAAQLLFERGGFPKSHSELLKLPGLGPYTARAVASLAFDEAVGVVDGNVIRVLSRHEARAWEWWQNKAKSEIQALADKWVENLPSCEINQGLMELGRTICTSKQPSCRLCPLMASCQAHSQERVSEFPLPKPRRAREIWVWEPMIIQRKDHLLLQKNSELPFLRGQWVLPGQAKKLSKPPTRFHYKHSITHHDIFVTVKTDVPSMECESSHWFPLKELRQHAPASLVHKAVAHSGRCVDGLSDLVLQARAQTAARPRRSKSRSRKL